MADDLPDGSLIPRVSNLLFPDNLIAILLSPSHVFPVFPCSLVHHLGNYSHLPLEAEMKQFQVHFM